MKIQLCSVGKSHDEYVKGGILDFTRRINRYYPVDWMIIPSPKNAGSLSATDLLKKESELILSFVKKDDYLVLLDELGRQINSEALADMIREKADQGTRQLVFLIGGAYGSDKSVSARADFTWSLSKLVFPHQLVRLILSEQVYRACTIIRNEKYHHS